MPHLDAAALSLDTAGLEFLGKVLEVDADFVLPRNAFSVPVCNSANPDSRIDYDGAPRRLAAIVEPA